MISFDEALIKTKARKNKRKRNTIIVVFSTVIFFICITFFGVIYFVNHKTILIDKNWKTRKYGDPAIKLETPIILRKIENQIPENLKPVINKMVLYNGIYFDFSLAVTEVNYNDTIVASIDGSIQGTIYEITNNENIENFDYKIEETKNGKKITGSLITNGKKFIYYNYFYSKKNTLWYITVTHEEKDKYAPKIVQRIFNSVII